MDRMKKHFRCLFGPLRWMGVFYRAQHIFPIKGALKTSLDAVGPVRPLTHVDLPVEIYAATLRQRNNTKQFWTHLTSTRTLRSESDSPVSDTVTLTIAVVSGGSSWPCRGSCCNDHSGTRTGLVCTGTPGRRVKFFSAAVRGCLGWQSFSPWLRNRSAD